jgi:exopolysaccharide biosynthesis WecB/TagA/CpsF family protein
MSPQVLVPSLALAPRSHVERRRIELGGVLIDNVDLSRAVDRIRGYLLSGQPHQIVTVNLDFISIARRDEGFRKVLNEADLAVADGMPLVWLSRLKRMQLPERVAGVDLVTQTCRLAAELEGRVFLLGAGPGVADAAARRLQERYPALQVAGTFSPSIGLLKRKENERMIRTIRDAAPDCLFVALGAPRQDLWIQQHQPELQVPVAMGVGCVFDLLAGSVRRAPRWMQKSGLEWAFRLGQEPQRLWKRYLLNDLPMLARLAVAAPRSEQMEALAGIS